MTRYPNICYFKVLGLTYGANIEDVTKAFHKKLFILHPDQREYSADYKELERRIKIQNPQQSGETSDKYEARIQGKMEIITRLTIEAGEILRNLEKRTAYMTFRENNPFPTYPSNTVRSGVLFIGGPLQRVVEDPLNPEIYDHILGKEIYALGGIRMWTEGNGFLHIERGWIVTSNASRTVIRDDRDGEVVIWNGDIEVKGRVYYRTRQQGNKYNRADILVNGYRLGPSDMESDGYIDLAGSKVKHRGARHILKPDYHLTHIIREFSVTERQANAAPAKDCI